VPICWMKNDVKYGIISIMNKTTKTLNTPPDGFRQSLFWDVDPKNIDAEKNARYVIERILEFGEPKEVKWLFGRYSKDEIKRVMNLPRSQVNRKSKALWSLMLTT